MVRKALMVLLVVLLTPLSSGLYQIRSTSIELKPWVEPIEICYIITYTGRVIRVSSGRDDSVWFIPTFEDVIGRHGIALNEVFIIVHNHLVPSGFSDDDIKLYNNLVSRGFIGIYALYTPGGRVQVIFPKKGEVKNER